jgi:hypothetical protein
MVLPGYSADAHAGFEQSAKHAAPSRPETSEHCIAATPGAMLALDWLTG